VSHNNLKKIDIIKDLSEKSGYSSNYSKKVINDLIESILQNIKNGNFNLKNIGSFSVITKKARIGRNPKTKKEHVISQRKSVSFKASKSLLTKLNMIT
tara:strand:- start:6472 stop:6765 length:294 start_codon:yes stop_codon:yes gene_type:complete